MRIIKNKILLGDEDAAVAYAREWIARLYKSQGLQPPRSKTLSHLATEIAADLGVGSFMIHEQDAFPASEASGRRIECECTSQD